MPWAFARAMVFGVFSEICRALELDGCFGCGAFFRNDLENFEDAALNDNPEIEEFRLLRRRD